MQSNEQNERITRAHTNPSLFSTPVAILIGSIVVAGSVLVSGALFKGEGSNNAPAVAVAKVEIEPEEKIKILSDFIAKKANVPSASINACITSGRFSTKISSDTASGSQIGVTGTPSAFVVNSVGSTQTISGAQPFTAVQALIDVALKNTQDSKTVTVPPITSADLVFGNPNSPVTLYEYSDLQCPFCNRFHDTVKEVLKKYDGQVKYGLRHFPLTFHPNAPFYAQAMECVYADFCKDKAYTVLSAIFSEQPLQ